MENVQISTLIFHLASASGGPKIPWLSSFGKFLDLPLWSPVEAQPQTFVMAGTVPCFPRLSRLDTPLPPAKILHGYYNNAFFLNCCCWIYELPLSAAINCVDHAWPMPTF